MGVLLLGPRSDPQLAAIEQELETRGVETYVWDADNWPGEGSLSFCQFGPEPRLEVDDAVIDSDTVHTVYLRNFGLNPRLPTYQEELEDHAYALLNQLHEYQAAIGSMLRHLDEQGVRMINPLSSQQIHKRKPWQLSVLAGAGVPVPETITTTDPDRVRTFVDRIDDVIYKPVSGGGHAAEIESSDLTDDRLSLLANSPVQFQERIDGDDIRVFVVDGEVVAAARIVSDKLDYRTERAEIEPIDAGELDSEMAEAALVAADRLELAFTAVDIVAGSDRFCVLEANPSPMFTTFDERAGTDVSDALADLLANPGTTPEAASDVTPMTTDR